MRIKALLFVMLVSFLVGQATEYPPPTNLVTIPTAGGLVRGSFAADLRLQKEGTLTAGLSVGVTDRFMFGLSYGASYLIGDVEPIAYPRPEVTVKYRLIDETSSVPGIAIGLDTQGYGGYNNANNVRRYDIKAYGAYSVLSKNWKSPLGNAGLHVGINYNFTERTDGDRDVSGFLGFDMEINPELALLLEYNAAFNENDKTLETMAVNNGYLNAAVRWTFVEHLHIEVDFNNLLFDADKVDYFNRELKITYIEYF